MLLAIFVLCVSMWFVGGSPTFEACANGHGQKNGEHSDQSAREGIGDFIDVATTYKRCAALFVIKQNAAITALSTVLLAFITVGLVYVGWEQSVTTRRQLRAYIFVESSGIFDGELPNGDRSPIAGVTIKNSGATPAYDVRHYCRLIYGELAEVERERLPGDIARLAPASIGPGGQTHSEQSLGRRLAAQEIADLAVPKTALCVLGKVTYVDAFGTRRETEYRLAWAGVYPPSPEAKLIFTSNGNRAN